MAGMAGGRLLAAYSDGGGDRPDRQHQHRLRCLAVGDGAVVSLPRPFGAIPGLAAVSAEGASYAAALLAVIAAPDSPEKAALLAAMDAPPDGTAWALPPLPARPGRPPTWPIGDAPRRRRGLDHRPTRLRFLHAIHHIELSAIDLAALLCLRASAAPAELHRDFLRVAREEAEHATLVAELLVREGFPPGSEPVHHKLWESALAAADLGEQLVIIPRFLEARGLDVSAELLPRLAAIDGPTHAVIARIYRDEIGHVGIGTRWHGWWCAARGLAPSAHFATTVEQHFGPSLPSPFALDRPGRTTAGFRDDELDLLAAPPWRRVAAVQAP